MKKEKLILPVSIIFGCVILGVFFYASQINKNKIEQSTKSEPQKEDVSFNKSLECQKLRSNALSVAKSFDIYAPPGSNWSSLIELFYSPITNSCISSFTYSNGEIKDSARQYYILYDLFSSKPLIQKEALPKNEKDRTSESFWDNTNELYTAEVGEYK